MEKQFVWLNDALTPISQARVSVNDRGFLYGDGLFETLRAEAGRVLFLPEHLERLEASARVFNLPFPGAVPWQERLTALLAANGLSLGPARIKILLSRGEAEGLGLPPGPRPTLVIWAQPYTPPSPAEYAGGWPVAVFPEGRSTFVGRHKSLNYLFYLAARQYALDRGAKEALILAADGLVSEGAATSLVYLHQGRYCTPSLAQRPARGDPGGTGPGVGRPGPDPGDPSHHPGPAPGGPWPLAGQLPHGPDASGRHRRGADAPGRGRGFPARDFGAIIRGRGRGAQTPPSPSTPLRRGAPRCAPSKGGHAGPPLQGAGGEVRGRNGLCPKAGEPLLEI